MHIALAKQGVYMLLGLRQRHLLAIVCVGSLYFKANSGTFTICLEQVGPGSYAVQLVEVRVALSTCASPVAIVIHGFKLVKVRPKHPILFLKIMFSIKNSLSRYVKVAGLLPPDLGLLLGHGTSMLKKSIKTFENTYFIN